MNRAMKYLAVALLTAAMALAQGMGHMGGGMGTTDASTMVQRRVEMLTTVLGLTDAQKTQALKIFGDAQTAITAARTKASSYQDALAAAVKKHDLTAIEQAAAALGTIQTNVMTIQAKAEADFYIILTPDQQAKFDKMPHGFGMGAGGGMGGGMRGGMNSSRKM